MIVCDTFGPPGVVVDLEYLRWSLMLTDCLVTYAVITWDTYHQVLSPHIATPTSPKVNEADTDQCLWAENGAGPVSWCWHTEIMVRCHQSSPDTSVTTLETTETVNK